MNKYILIHEILDYVNEIIYNRRIFWKRTINLQTHLVIYKNKHLFETNSFHLFCLDEDWCYKRLQEVRKERKFIINSL